MSEDAHKSFSEETEGAKKEALRIIEDINNNRQKHIDTFVNAWLAVNAPPQFDAEWLINNVVLQVKSWVGNGVAREEYKLELKR